MDNRVKWIEYKDAKLLLIDYSNLRFDEDLMEIFNSSVEIMNNSQEDIKYIIDFSNAYITSKFHEYCEIEKTKITTNIVKRSFVGMKGVKKTLYNNWKSTECKSASNFESRMEAFEYLIN